MLQEQPTPPGIANESSDLTDVLADRISRFMLEAVGMSRPRRWLTCAAVAFGTNRTAIA
jgi:hypothetical protein